MNTFPTTVDNSGVYEQLIRHFIPANFLAVLGLSGLAQLIGERVQLAFTTDDALFLFIALANAVFVVISSILLRFATQRRFLSVSECNKGMLPPVWIGTLIGFMLPAVGFSPYLMAVYMLLLVCLAWVSLKRLGQLLVPMLAPGSCVTWDGLKELIRGYLVLITSFTLINGCMEYVYELAGEASPFGFAGGEVGFTDSLYFTLVVMTTLGFGDIAPQTPASKLLVGLECFVGYACFTLVVGIITRGVQFSQDVKAE